MLSVDLDTTKAPDINVLPLNELVRLLDIVNMLVGVLLLTNKTFPVVALLPCIVVKPFLKVVEPVTTNELESAGPVMFSTVLAESPVNELDIVVDPITCKALLAVKELDIITEPVNELVPITCNVKDEVQAEAV